MTRIPASAPATTRASSLQICEGTYAYRHLFRPVLRIYLHLTVHIPSHIAGEPYAYHYIFLPYSGSTKAWPYTYSLPCCECTYAYPVRSACTTKPLYRVFVINGASML
jgi:hypothetical protein